MMKLLMGLSPLFEILRREREEIALNVTCLLTQIQALPFSPLPPPIADSSISSTSNRAYPPLASAKWTSPAWNWRLAGEWSQGTYSPGFPLKLFQAGYVPRSLLLSRLLNMTLSSWVLLESPSSSLRPQGLTTLLCLRQGPVLLHTCAHLIIKPSPSIRIWMRHLFLVQYSW